MEQTVVLDILRESEALLEGHFELRSGLHSDRFFQCANVLRYPDKAEKLCNALVADFNKAMTADCRVDTVVAPAMGGIVVGHEVARALGTKSIFVEKQDGDLVLRRFNIKQGERVVIAEDVITRGGRVQETIDILEGCGAEIVGILLLVDRSGGKVTFKYPTFSLLQMEPVTHEPDDCPLCKQDLELVHPGS